MSLLYKIFGNAVKANIDELNKNYSDLLIESESIVAGYKLIRDAIIFTNERLILVDVQGLTGTKVSYTSIPFSTIKIFKMESAGTFDMDCEIKLYLQGNYTLPIDLKFLKGTDLKPIYQLLSKYILRDN